MGSQARYGALVLARLVVAACASAALGLASIGAPVAQATPADPYQVITLHQPNGSAFSARQFGDEWYHGFETVTGYTVVKDSSGVWEYAARSGNRLVPSGKAVDGGPPAGTPRHLRSAAALARARSYRSSARAPAGAPASSTPMNSGTQRSLVILARFANQGSLGTTAADWHNQFFGATGSVAAYYEEASYGLLTIAPAAENDTAIGGTANDGVVGWVTLPTNHPNTDVAGNPLNQQMVANAINAADPYVNYASYDSNHDGWITPSELHVTVIAAGYEASTDCGSPWIWGHRWGTGSYTPQRDGVYVGAYGYTAFGEMQCSASVPAHPATIGVMVHEIGHDLSWPDLYDYDDSTYGGVGSWSVMAYGNWNSLPGQYRGTTPAGPDAFLRSYQGWMTPAEVHGSAPATALAYAESNPFAVQLGANPNGVDWLFAKHSGNGQYFLVENRQQIGIDAALPGCGILIWHIDETAEFGHDSVSANDDDAHRLVSLEQADGNPNYPFDASDAWRGARVFNATSVPNSRLNNAAASGVSAENFSGTCAPTMTADLVAPTSSGTAVAKTGTATNISQTTARVTGAVNPGGVATSYRFQYGKTTSYGSSTPIGNAGAGTSDVGVASTLTGLAGGTRYHFRAVALRSGSIVSAGFDRTFITLPAPKLTSLKLSPAKFKAANSGPSVVTGGKAGTRVTFRLNVRATVTFMVQRLQQGHAVKKGTFKWNGKAGANSFRFTGRVAGHKLAPGSYRLVVTARGTSGNVTTPVRVAFTIRQ